MKNKQHIYLASPQMSKEGYEQQYVKEAFDTNWVAPMGNNVNEFEKELAEKTGAGAAAALVSGTSAIHLALKALEAGPGDLVFCQSLTFAATANPIIYTGAKPVFIDSDEDTWNISPAALEKAMEKYCRMEMLPKAVIVVHLYGKSADMDKITSICHKYGVPVIEDAAESLGSRYKGKYTGTLGTYGVFSFNGNKIITTSGGGMLVCNIPKPEIAEKCIGKVRFWATQAREQELWYQHEEIGYNYRMSNISAGIGRGQLKVLEERIQKKREIYQYYKKELGELKGVSLMPLQDWEYCNCWLTAIRLDDNAPCTPLDVIRALEEDDVESRPIWKPLHLQPVFSSYDFVSQVDNLRIENTRMGADNSVAGTIFRQGVCMPSDTNMQKEDLERICSILKKLWEL